LDFLLSGQPPAWDSGLSFKGYGFVLKLKKLIYGHLYIGTVGGVFIVSDRTSYGVLDGKREVD
jgi:hypothetical protein